MADSDSVQEGYRRQLANCWQIPPGARVLEVGCGQGDMTSVLAETASHVTAVDIADPSYGSPLTLGEATDLIRSGPFGHKIDFRFNFDILQSQEFEPDSFDFGIMAHCSWYFSSEDELRAVFAKLRSCCQRFCFAEWDLEPRTVDQLPHLLAVLIQGQVESFKAESNANVRTPFNRKSVERLLSASGWEIAQAGLPDTSALQDADWEIGACLRDSLREAQELALPPKLYSLLESQVDLLSHLKEDRPAKPLGAYALVLMHD